MITDRCWMRSDFTPSLVVSYITAVAFPCMVILYNACLLGLVVFKLWRIRGSSRSSSWKKVDPGTRLWKDSFTVLGLSCLLGLPWSLASTTYISLPGIYVFTILNSLQGQYERDHQYIQCSNRVCAVLYWFAIRIQRLYFLVSGVFLFLWSVALTCKSRSDKDSSATYPSSQKMTTLNNWSYICVYMCVHTVPSVANNRCLLTFGLVSIYSVN